MVDVQGGSADGIHLLPISSRPDDFHGCVLRWIGESFSKANRGKGRWQPSGHHINWLEWRAVLTAIQLLQFGIKGLCALVLVDNTTAVAYFRNQGGTKSRALSKLTRRILLLASSLRISIVRRHITGQLNVLARTSVESWSDGPSEWALSSEAFNCVVDQSPWGPPKIDLSSPSPATAGSRLTYHPAPTIRR